mmetsp:Transcript_53736/g.155026  ORF Transcript_53736/g.155026 Transcript_53736/m.155026 type:complete len:294 (+) Transcript_53736:61-942(+)
MANAQLVVRNTFLEVVEEPSTPMAPPPPTKTAPGSLQDAPAESEAAKTPGRQRPSVLRRLFGIGSRATGGSMAAGEAPALVPRKKSVRIVAPAPPPLLLLPATPVSLQEKNTFVHFAESPSLMGPPPARSAPGQTAFLGGSAAEDVSDGPPVLTGGSPSGLGLRDAATVEWHGPVVPPLPAPAAAARCCASLGSEGHRDGRCIPCLMQVRWGAGKLSEPCRFGELCGRCHEAHTEEELQRVQAAMRKLKRRGGAAGAAALSAAYVSGAAAPVGGGAGKATRSEQSPQVIEVSV